VRPAQPGGRVALVLAGAIALAGCGRDEPPPDTQPLGPSAKLQQADCGDWKRASVEGRKLTVDRLEQVVRGPNGEGRTLPDDSAYNVINARCKQYAARGFLLYEMYTRAAAFQAFTRGG
jgi:hypothetical protein